MNLPEPFQNRMKALLGSQYPDFEQALNDPPVKGLISGVKLPAAQLADQLPFSLNAVPYYANGFYFSAPSPGRHPLHHAGAFYVQDPSAMAAVCSLPVQKGWRVLDCCAAPGGKSIQLGAAIGPGGLLVSNEIDRGRSRVLASNIERMGLTNTIVTRADAGTLGQWYPDYFDFVLADAPCSGEGMFRKYPEALADWSEGKSAACAALQKEILQQVSACVCPGGYLLYSTCTFSPEENEAVVEDFLDRHGDFALCQVAPVLLAYTQPGLTERTRLARRFYPHTAPGEGQFFALLRRAGDPTGRRQTPSYANTAKPTSRQEQAVLDEFLKRNTKLDATALSVVSMGGSLWAVPAYHPVPERGTVACGVQLGMVQKGVFRPHHQFFSAYGGQFVRQIELPADSEQAALYLSGHPLVSEGENGWCCVCIAGCPAGGGKRVDGVVKNHYPKGLRQPLLLG